MSNSKSPPSAGRSDVEPAVRQGIDNLIDEMSAQSFPASDPPAYGSISLRLEQEQD